MFLSAATHKMDPKAWEGAVQEQQRTEGSVAAPGDAALQAKGI